MVNRHALAYVRGLDIADTMARRVFLLLVERTNAPGDRYRFEDVPEITGLELQDADIPVLAGRLGLDVERSASSCVG
ncbi:hypothetical protein [Streptomyces sp. CT34]|uniref:hypothetical protein n=1 Tax=Streptomyces sp. CT34 TaxID=1553907 RepID=UPI0005BA400E|nr:hypothetical protein [Streptomyces sp. CT34]